MDFWVFVAAASAGCLSMYLKSTLRDLKSCKAALNGSWHIASLAHGKRMNRYGDASWNSDLDEKALGTNPTVEVASTSGSEERIARNLEDFNFLSIGSFPMEYSANVVDGTRENESSSGRDIWSGSGDARTGNFEGINCSFQLSVKYNCSLRSRYRNLRLKQLTSLESCLVAQLHNHHAVWEDRPRSSPKPRPLLVSDGSNIISHRSDSLIRERDAKEAIGIQKQSHIERSRNVVGVPPLPSLPTKIRSDERSVISIGSVGRRKFFPQNGLTHGIILFYLGVYVGIVSSVARKKTDVDKLKEMLKETENLVWDLQEELEMKDLVVVNELDNDMYGSRGTHQTSFPGVNPNPSSNERREGDVSKELDKPGTGNNMDSMSKIEAELEAELERLGLNVGLCNVQGHNLEKDGSSSSSTARSANYAVSPRALTLRLHELIQSRLEERIQQLELALENSQRKVWLMESTQKDRTNRQFFNNMAQPVIMNLPSKALSGYNETYEEFTKFVSSEENTPSCRYNSPACQRVISNGAIEKIGDVSGQMSAEPLLLHGVVANGTLSCEQDTDCLGMSRDENSNAEDEVLIKQLVERTKRGSPTVMRVQRLLFTNQDGLH